MSHKKNKFGEQRGVVESETINADSASDTLYEPQLF